jgi:putative ABC transport system permease protein
MLRSYLSAAFGNIGRNGFYAAITILGLAVSFAAAILIGLFLRDEYTFDGFVKDHQRVYRASSIVTLPGAKPGQVDLVPSTLAAYLKLDFPEIERAARLEGWKGVIRKDNTTVEEPLVWVDPDFFQVMSIPVLAGDANAALAAPDGLVLTRAMARKYFGEDAPIGKVLQVNTSIEIQGLPLSEQRLLTEFHSMRVMAVIKDPPSNSHLRAKIFASGRAAFSLLSLDDRHPSPFNLTSMVYVKLKPGASAAAVAARLPAFADRRFPGANRGPSVSRYSLMPLASLHFSAARPAGVEDDTLRPPGDRRVDAGVAGEGVLIVLIAAINFVTLMTARATRRAVEVGVRKAAGARQSDLVIQFMGEALIYVAIAMIGAVVIAEMALPAVNAFLDRSLTFDYLGDPWIAAAILGGVALTSALAGLYPAMVLSAFRPATALKGGATAPSGAARARQALVVAQFAIVIGLILVTATIYRQTQFALHDALRLDTSQNVRITTSCRSPFHDQLPTLPGIREVSCGSFAAMAVGGSSTFVAMPDGTNRTLSGAPVDVGFLEMHGIKPVAGRFFSEARGEDVVLHRPDAGPNQQPTLVLNESAVRQLGLKSPADAVGKTVRWTRWTAGTNNFTLPPANPSQVIGVAPDFTLGTIRSRIEPAIYYVDPAGGRLIVVKLDGARMPEALRAMSGLWRRLGHDRPLSFAFEDATVQALYRDVITQGAAIGVCAGLAVMIACLGLFALAAFVTERRVKEIGVRKAMGAGTADVVRLLLWQFTKPVLWANLVAWPAAFFILDWWLHGFAYRVGQPVWLFLAASLTAAVIAWATVSFQSWMAARARPATALRYE